MKKYYVTIEVRLVVEAPKEEHAHAVAILAVKDFDRMVDAYKYDIKGVDVIAITEEA